MPDTLSASLRGGKVPVSDISLILRRNSKLCGEYTCFSPISALADPFVRQ
ncbi:hypothetical protein Y88_2943 [Novosphingobium nitrogenifigens DSM 19370]|uniref:Uncharacterized protein n=1 Tax=Novosphingobium nitrogenifigens DSM 19370 TaxID=983920 RepID=F1ZCP3_9SPHN|nr:hypothetical protein Y88_2943 [Novosphingobium nitrogenifigens DSM 19370]